jgi:hypothetical protein
VEMACVIRQSDGQVRQEANTHFRGDITRCDTRGDRPQIPQSAFRGLHKGNLFIRGILSWIEDDKWIQCVVLVVIIVI